MNRLCLLAVAALCAAVASGEPSTLDGEAFELDGEASTLLLDSNGYVASLHEKSTGRELLAKPTPFARLRTEDGRSHFSCDLDFTGKNRFVCTFKDGAGAAEFSVAPFPGGWTFEVVRLDAPGAHSLAFARVTPACAKWKGPWGPPGVSAGWNPAWKMPWQMKKTATRNG